MDESTHLEETNEGLLLGGVVWDGRLRRSDGRRLGEDGSAGVRLDGSRVPVASCRRRSRHVARRCQTARSRIDRSWYCSIVVVPPRRRRIVELDGRSGRLSSLLRRIPIRRLQTRSSSSVPVHPLTRPTLPHMRVHLVVIFTLVPPTLLLPRISTDSNFSPRLHLLVRVKLRRHSRTHRRELITALLAS
jgi:hypothetical protein